MTGWTGIREARHRAGLSVPEIAEQLGVSATAVWNWDRGKSIPRPEMAERLATLLGIDSAELSGGSGRARVDRADDTHLSCGDILSETKVRLARKLGIPERAFEIRINITR